MKRSRLRRGAALALVLSSFATACSAFRLPSDVAMKQVPVDLVFGGDVQQVGQQVPPALPEPGVIELPELPEGGFVRPKPPQVDVCPPPAGSSAKAMPSTITHEDGTAGVYTPRAGNRFPFRSFVDLDVDKKPQFEVVDFRLIDEVRTRGPSWEFILLDPVTGVSWWWEVVAESPDDEGDGVDPTGSDDDEEESGGDPGLYLTKIVWPSNHVNPTKRTRLEFIPQPTLKVANFPLTEGEELTSVGQDVALKGEGIDVPVIGRVNVSPNRMTLKSSVGPRQIVEVCADLAQAQLVNLSLETKGNYTWNMVGTFWFSMLYGGMQVREDYIMIAPEGDLLSGSFHAHLMRLKPTEYL